MRRIRLLFLVLPVILLGAALFVYGVLDVLGGECRGDLLEGGDVTCNTLGSAQHWIAFDGLAVFAAAVLTWLVLLPVVLWRPHRRHQPG